MSHILDPDSVHSRVYRELVCSPRSTLQSLAERTDLTVPALRKTLEQLRIGGAVVLLQSADGDRWEAQPPEALVGERIRSEEKRLAELRSVGDDLGRMFRLARMDGMNYPGLEVVDDRDLILDYFRRLQAEACQDVRAIDRPPYVGGDGGEEPQAELQAERMAAGVKYRVIYKDSITADPVRCAKVMSAMAGGEQARVLAHPPVKIIIADGQRALIALDPTGMSAPVSLIVHPSALLNALISIFDTLWLLAVPISPDTRAKPLDDTDRAIITLMASGATDDVIARRMGISRRSVVRRSSALLERLSAANRFQAGVQAARRGWL